MVAQPKIEGKLTKLFSLVHGDDNPNVACIRASFATSFASQSTPITFTGPGNTGVPVGIGSLLARP